MTEYTKQVRNFSDEEIRGLFGEKIDAYEKLLWHDGGFYKYGNDKKGNYIGGIVVSALFVVCVCALAFTVSLMGREVPAVAILIVILFVALCVAAFTDSLIGVTYPRYYVLTDKQIIYCKRGIFNRTAYHSFLTKDICCVSVHDRHNEKTLNISRRGTDDTIFVITGVDNLEYVKDLISDAAGLEKTPSCFN